MHLESDHADALQPFIDEGWLDSILFDVKSGKEATVFCCRAGDRADVPLIAAKVYRPIETRRFKNDAAYVGGRVHMARDGRFKRAVDNKSAFGRRVQYGTWIAQEWEVMNVLAAAGVPLPRPLALGDRAILMPFVGDEDGAAPMLHHVQPSRPDAARIVDELLDVIELMLDHDCVHGDLSPYNIMLHDERIVIIDFPQAVDPRLNPNGAALLARDVENVCRWASKHGVRRPATAITRRLWTRFTLGELG